MIKIFWVKSEELKKMNKNYLYAKERYGEIGIDTDKAIEKVRKVPISIHSWQLDDVIGFESSDSGKPSGGVISIGDYPGRAKTIEQYWQDLEKVISLVPGDRKKISIQSTEGDYQGKLKNRNDMSKEHFLSWIDWAKKNKVGIDLSPVFYSHENVKDGYTISSKDKAIREFWIEYEKKNREIANFIGKSLNWASISNFWIPDGSKDITPSRYDHRMILKEALDEIYAIKYPKENLIDTLECKLFGIGFEFYNTGSMEFYIAYAVQNNLGFTLDTGHFHPTEEASNKISSLLPFLDDVVLHLSRGLHWDSDHVTILTDELVAIMQEIVRADAFDKVHIGTDFFDASMNRIGALALGARAVEKALLIAMLEPVGLLKEYEANKDYFSRLALLDDMKSMPFGDVWEHYCEICGVPANLGTCNHL